MTNFKIILGLIISVFLISCGGGGGGGGSQAPTPAPKPTPQPAKPATGAEKFASDMVALNNMPLQADQVDQERRGVFTKLFGGTTVQNVANFINERASNVYGDDELADIEVDVYENGNYVGSDTLNGIFEIKNQPENPEAKAFILATNYGVALFNIQQKTGYKLKLHLGGEPVDVTSTRIGLIGLSKYFDTVPGTDLKMPLEARIGTIVHEGRHSDCPSTADDLGICGYTHMKCWDGHDLAGEYACDQRPFGSYGVEAIYTMAVAKNYDLKTIDGQIMQFTADDLVGRIDKANWDLMETTDPDLSSL